MDRCHPAAEHVAARVTAPARADLLLHNVLVTTISGKGILVISTHRSFLSSYAAVGTQVRARSESHELGGAAPIVGLTTGHAHLVINPLYYACKYCKSV